MIGWIIVASFSTTKEIFTGTLLATGLHFENYVKALITNKAALNLLNSTIYTVPACILVILVSAPCAYCLSRFKFKGSAVLERQCSLIPEVYRGRVWCMHLGSDFYAAIREAGFERDACFFKEAEGLWDAGH